MQFQTMPFRRTKCALAVDPYSAALRPPERFTVAREASHIPSFVDGAVDSSALGRAEHVICHPVTLETGSFALLIRSHPSAPTPAKWTRIRATRPPTLNLLADKGIKALLPHAVRHYRKAEVDRGEQ